MCLHNNGFSPPDSTVIGGPPNGGGNGGYSVRFGDGAYNPTQSSNAVIKTIAPFLATMNITQVQAGVPIAGQATYTYSGYVGNGDAASGIFVNMDIIIAGCANSGNNIDSIVISMTGGPSAGTFVAANAGAVNESPGAATGTAASDSLCGLAVRVTPDFQNGYFTFIGTNSGRVGGSQDKRVYVVELWAIVDGVATGITSTPVFTSIPDVPGDKWALFATAGNITLQKNGATILGPIADVKGQRGGWPGISGQALSNDTALNYPGNNGTVWTTWNGNDGATPTVTNGWKTQAGEWASGLATGIALGNYWSALSGIGLIALKNITGNPGTITSNGVTIGTGLYTGRTWAPNQSSQVTIGAVGVAANTYYLLVRSNSVGWNAGGTSYYGTAVNFNGSSNGWALGKWVNGVNTGIANLSTGASNTLAPGDVFRLQVQGQTIQLLKNGVSVLTGTDSSILTGSPAFMIQQSEFITNWTGDEFVTPAGSGGIGGGGGGFGVSADFGYRL